MPGEKTREHKNPRETDEQRPERTWKEGDVQRQGQEKGQPQRRSEEMPRKP